MSPLTPDQWLALSPYLDTALELSPAERGIWLSSVRQENPTLTDQLEILLENHRALLEEGFLESSPVGSGRGWDLAGQTLGVYTLVSQIGQGGMGSVWLAERNDGRFERQVAVKLGRALRAQGKHPEAASAFQSATENLQATLGSNHPDTRNSQQIAELENKVR